MAAAAAATAAAANTIDLPGDVDVIQGRAEEELENIRRGKGADWMEVEERVKELREGAVKLLRKAEGRLEEREADVALVDEMEFLLQALVERLGGRGRRRRWRRGWRRWRPGVWRWRRSSRSRSGSSKIISSSISGGSGSSSSTTQQQQSCPTSIPLLAALKAERVERIDIIDERRKRRRSSRRRTGGGKKRRGRRTKRRRRRRRRRKTKRHRR